MYMRTYRPTSTYQPYYKSVFQTHLADSPWLVLQYFPNGDLKSYLTVSQSSIAFLL